MFGDLLANASKLELADLSSDSSRPTAEIDFASPAGNSARESDDLPDGLAIDGLDPRDGGDVALRHVADRVQVVPALRLHLLVPDCFVTQAPRG